VAIHAREVGTRPLCPLVVARDAGKLFDYVRRGELGVLTREADGWRELAYSEAAA